jgi:hypothetical protein
MTVGLGGAGDAGGEGHGHERRIEPAGPGARGDADVDAPRGACVAVVAGGRPVQAQRVRAAGFALDPQVAHDTRRGRVVRGGEGVVAHGRGVVALVEGAHREVIRVAVLQAADAHRLRGAGHHGRGRPGDHGGRGPVGLAQRRPRGGPRSASRGRWRRRRRGHSTSGRWPWARPRRRAGRRCGPGRTSGVRAETGAEAAPAVSALSTARRATKIGRSSGRPRRIRSAAVPPGATVSAPA